MRSEEIGYLLVFGQRQPDHPVFMGWASSQSGGVTKLLSSLQRAYPCKLEVLGFARGTETEVEKLVAKFEPALIDGTDRWFHPCDQIDSLLAQLRGPELEEEDNPAPVLPRTRSPRLNHQDSKSSRQRRRKAA